MIKTRKNKKAVIFWPALVVFTSILFLMYLFIALNSKETIVENFGKDTEKLNDYNFKIFQLNIFENSLDSYFKKPIYFYNDKGLLNLNSEFISKIDKEGNYIGGNCIFNKKYLWINDEKKVNCYDIIKSTYLRKLYNYTWNKILTEYRLGVLYFGFISNVSISIDKNNNLKVEAQSFINTSSFSYYNQKKKI